MPYGHVCNPYCGKCRPPLERPLVCPECETLNYPERGETEFCKKCGARLPEREIRPVIRCSRSGLVCANPCGMNSVLPEDGGLAACTLVTPPTAEQLATIMRKEKLLGRSRLMRERGDCGTNSD